MTAIFTVGDIRMAIEGRADDELVHNQIVAADGTVRTTACVIAPTFQQQRGLMIDLRHPELKTLPRN